MGFRTLLVASRLVSLKSFSVGQFEESELVALFGFLPLWGAKGLTVFIAQLQGLPVHQRADAVHSLVYQANARVCNPVYGCVGAISALQQQLEKLRTELAMANAEMVTTISMQRVTTSVESTHHDGNGNYVNYHEYQQSSQGGQPMTDGGRMWN